MKLLKWVQQILYKARDTNITKLMVICGHFPKVNVVFPRGDMHNCLAGFHIHVSWFMYRFRVQAARKLSSELEIMDLCPSDLLLVSSITSIRHQETEVRYSASSS